VDRQGVTGRIRDRSHRPACSRWRWEPASSLPTGDGTRDRLHDGMDGAGRHQGAQDVEHLGVLGASPSSKRKSRPRWRSRAPTGEALYSGDDDSGAGRHGGWRSITIPLGMRQGDSTTSKRTSRTEQCEEALSPGHGRRSKPGPHQAAIGRDTEVPKRARATVTNRRHDTRPWRRRWVEMAS